ncbi:MAG: MBL fold metallo-hydrolase [Pseudopedobacter saltans]|uniref:MBL fold metallo-hydrolase n=1 Tax=Pseudopedobacter saltans TaxID=151895 RepID=A0A2W5FCA7_9SPHI|nr:MAG: MBL fold metallo-hydrolase [Pseudopedobacter saltans]
MKTHALIDGIFAVDNTKKFTPFNPEKDDFAMLPHGSQVLAVSPFLVVTSSDIVLLDGGLGTKDENGQSILLKNLAALGYSADDISMVILSHLHKDHIAGLGTLDEKENFYFHFPKAKLFFQEKEMAYALGSSTPSFNKSVLSGLANQPNVQLLNGDGDISDEISYFVTGGHTPYHQAINIEGPDQKVFFGADVAPLLFQMKHSIVGKYDYDGRKAATWRKEWWAQGQEEHWKFLFYHDFKQPILEV